MLVLVGFPTCYWKVLLCVDSGGKWWSTSGVLTFINVTPRKFNNSFKIYCFLMHAERRLLHDKTKFNGSSRSTTISLIVFKL